MMRRKALTLLVISAPVTVHGGDKAFLDVIYMQVFGALMHMTARAAVPYSYTVHWIFITPSASTALMLGWDSSVVTAPSGNLTLSQCVSSRP